MNAASRRCDCGPGGGRVGSVFGLGALLLALVVLLLPVTAAGAVDLYSASIAVRSEDPAEREQASRLGLLQVLVRLTAQPGVSRAPGVAAMLDDSSGYLQQYSYRPAADGNGRVLTLTYDRTAVIQSLRDASLPVWLEADRPRMLVWLVFDEGGSRQLVGGDVRPEVQEELRRAGELDGLAVLVPLLDLADRRLVRTTDVWGAIRQPIQEASARYGTEVVLVGRVVVSADARYQTRWTLYQSDRMDEWSVTVGSRYAMIRSGIRGAVSRLAADRARLPGDRVLGAVRMDVFGVNDLEDYAAVHRQLAIARGVHRFDVSEVSGDRLSLHIEVEGDIEQLLAGFERSGRFQRPGEGDPANGANTPVLRAGVVSLQLLP